MFAPAFISFAVQIALLALLAIAAIGAAVLSLTP